jgi:hypothetical protein
MDNRPDPRDPEIADAESLFRDAPAPRPAPQPPRPAPAGDAGHYEVEERAEPAPTAWVPPPGDDARTVPASAPRPAVTSSPRLEPSEAVEQVWSRGAEWGGTLGLLAVVAVGLFVLLYATVSSELYALALLILLAGGLALTILSYPILITLERPVRITPEQAVRDYYAALSHHVPHYRRMWLLLSNAGHVSGAFASLEGLKNYWKKRLAELRAGRASGITPLKFQVEDFRSEKSAGRTDIEATFTVKVFVRGRHQDGPIEEFRTSATLVKGPDRMWYLDKGTLP